MYGGLDGLGQRDVGGLVGEDGVSRRPVGCSHGGHQARVEKGSGDELVTEPNVVL